MAAYVPNRRARHAIAARSRCVIQKGVPFGRTGALDMETGDHQSDNRVIYRHMGRGVIDRQMTDALLEHLIQVTL